MKFIRTLILIVFCLPLMAKELTAVYFQPRKTTIVGIIETETFPGPPGYESIAKEIRLSGQLAAESLASWTGIRNYSTGHATLLDCLRTTYKNATLEFLISKFAPAFENDTKNYLRFLVKKNKKGTIVEYFVVEFGWVSKQEGIRLAKKGKIDAVIATSRSGNLFSRTHRDVIVENNLDNLG